MNAESAETPPLAQLPSANGWSWKKITCLILFALATHLAFIFLLGAKKTAAPRAVTNVPVFRLTDNASELVQLTDPTLFVLPHARDFTAASVSPPAVTDSSFAYTEPPSFLPLAADRLGAAFATFMQTNRFAGSAINFKPQPQFVLPVAVIESVLPQNSTWQLAGEIAGRKILNPFTAPTLPLNDVIAPSRVQLLVDTGGNVVSAVLLQTSGSDNADQQALQLARALRFFPADNLTFGEIIFNWYTVPVVSAP